MKQNKKRNQNSLSISALVIVCSQFIPRERQAPRRRWATVDAPFSLDKIVNQVQFEGMYDSLVISSFSFSFSFFFSETVRISTTPSKCIKRSSHLVSPFVQEMLYLQDETKHQDKFFLSQVSEAISRTAYYANILLVGGPKPQEDDANVGHRQQPGLLSISCLGGYLFRGPGDKSISPVSGRRSGGCEM